MNKRTVVQLVKDVDEESITAFEKRLKGLKFSTDIVRFSPSLAKHILEKYNIGNRSMKPGKITAYRSDMKADLWGLTGDTLKFDKHGLLKDGQNRLRACMESGASFASVVVFGIDPELFHKMDVGKTRDPSDILNIAGYSNTARLASALRWAGMFDSDSVPSRRSFTPSEVLDLASQIGDMSEELAAAASIYTLNRYPIGINAALYREFSKRSEERCAEFYSAWRQGIYKGRFKILEKLNKALAVEKERARGRVHEFVYIALTITAWNAFIENRAGRTRDFEWDLKSEEIPEIRG